jgi:hypothetical protein
VEIAPLRHLLLTFLVAVACPACLITDPVDFPERENHPPTAVSFEPSLNDHVEVNRQGEGITFAIVVFDEDESDLLEARAFVNERVAQNVPTVEVSPGGQLRTVRVRFNEPVLDFAKRGCHVVGMYVVDSPAAWDETTFHDVDEGVIQVQGVWNVIAHDGDGLDDIAAVGCGP